MHRIHVFVHNYAELSNSVEEIPLYWREIVLFSSEYNRYVYFSLYTVILHENEKVQKFKVDINRGILK